MTDDEKWLKRKIKEGPYYLYHKLPKTYFAGWDRSVDPPTQIFRDGFIYTVLWRHKDKVRIGKFKDGMYARYGVAVWGVLNYPYGITDLWQSSRGAVDETELSYMQELGLNKVINLPQFDLNELQDVKW